MANYLNKIVKFDMAQSSEATHVYLDIGVVNADDGSLGLSPSPLRFSEARQKPIITDPSSYFMSLIRFHIDTTMLPAMIPTIMLGQSDVNKTIYSFTLSFRGTDFQQYIEFAPQDLTTATPAPPLTSQDIASGYYNISSFQYFVRLCNIALASCHSGLKKKSVVGLPTDNPPYLLYDPASNEIIFMLDQAGYDNSLVGPIQLYFNTPCYNLFCSFQTQTMSYADPNGKNYLLIAQNENDTNLSIMNNYTAIQCYQEYASTSTWSCVQSIVICSSTLPINGTMQSQTSINGSLPTINYSGGISVPVISDFEVALDNGLDYKPSINYSPFIFRMIDLVGHQELTNLSIEVFWKDNNSNMYPLLIPANSNCNLKILFRKKYLGV